MMLPFMVGMSFLVLGIILLLGKLIRVITPNLQKLFIPSSLIGGFLALVLGPRITLSYWFERGIGNFGQSMGMTASGLLLMKITDPNNRFPALESFGYKQLMFEPIVGEGCLRLHRFL